jgi:Tol biopolymer transport system component
VIGRVAACVVLVGAGLAACGGDGNSGAGGCGPDAPAIAFDHETTDPNRGIGGGVPEVSVVSAGGDVEMITGSWVAGQATFSPDGDRLAVVKADGDYESAGPQATALWVLGTGGEEPTQLTGGEVLDEDPDWSADGSSVVFVRGVGNSDGYTWSISTVPAGGGEAAALLTVRDGKLDGPVWSPDGRRIAFVRTVFDAASDPVKTVWTMAADGRGARPLLDLAFVDSLDWRPDGTSLLVDTGGRTQETFLVDPRTGGARSVGSGTDLATWSPDGRRVYYFRGEGGSGEEDWRIVQGRIEDAGLVDDRTVLDEDDLGGTVLADVGLHPGFSLAVGPCG